jgi:hypothetical protein
MRFFLCYYFLLEIPHDHYSKKASCFMILKPLRSRSLEKRAKI